MWGAGTKPSVHTLYYGWEVLFSCRLRSSLSSSVLMLNQTKTVCGNLLCLYLVDCSLFTDRRFNSEKQILLCCGTLNMYKLYRMWSIEHHKNVNWDVQLHLFDCLLLRTTVWFNSPIFPCRHAMNRCQNNTSCWSPSSLNRPLCPSALRPRQDILSYQRRSAHRLSPGLYLGYLKLSSSVDQIKVLVSQRSPNMLCHVRVRENANVSRCGG